MSLTLKNCNVLESIISYSFLIGSVVRGFDHLLVDCYSSIWKPIKKNANGNMCLTWVLLVSKKVQFSSLDLAERSQANSSYEDFLLELQFQEP